MNSQIGSFNPSIAQTPAGTGFAQTPAQPGVLAPPQTLDGGNGQSMNRAMQDQIINSGSSNEGSHDSGRGSSGNSQEDMMRKQMMM